MSDLIVLTQVHFVYTCRSEERERERVIIMMYIFNDGDKCMIKTYYHYLQ